MGQAAALVHLCGITRMYDVTVEGEVYRGTGYHGMRENGVVAGVANNLNCALIPPLCLVWATRIVGVVPLSWFPVFSRSASSRSLPWSLRVAVLPLL